MKLTTSVTTILAVLAIGSFASAVTTQMYCKTELKEYKSCKNIPENRRKELGDKVSGGNPVAITNEKGNLVIWYTVGDSPDLKPCQTTNNVDFFKMSANPKDLSTAYFVKKGEMLDVKMHGSVSKANCPSASTQNYSTDNSLGKVLDVKVVPDSHSSIVAAGLTSGNYVILSYDSSIKNEGPFRDQEEAKAYIQRVLGN